MRLQEYIIKNKEKILWAFCNIYGNDLYNKIANRFDQIEFLFPNLQPEDYNKCLDEICYHPNNVESIPQIEVIRKIKDVNECGFFIPLLRKGENNDFTLHYFIIINSNSLDYSYENLDVVLFHELKHCLTYHIQRDKNDIVYNKSGLSLKINNYSQNYSNVSVYYTDINEVLTQFDAEQMTKKLHQCTEILPKQQQKGIPFIWCQNYYELLFEYFQNKWDVVRMLEMTDNIDDILQEKNSKVLNEMENKVKFPYIDIRRQLIKKR